MLRWFERFAERAYWLQRGYQQVPYQPTVTTNAVNTVIRYCWAYRPQPKSLWRRWQYLLFGR